MEGLREGGSEEGGFGCWGGEGRDRGTHMHKAGWVGVEERGSEEK